MSDHQSVQKKTPKEALLDALAECEAIDEFREVLIVYNTKSGKSGSFDSGLTSAEAGYLAFMFLMWTAGVNMGFVVGNLKQQLFEHVDFREKHEPEEKTGQDPEC